MSGPYHYERFGPRPDTCLTGHAPEPSSTRLFGSLGWDRCQVRPGLGVRWVDQQRRLPTGSIDVRRGRCRPTASARGPAARRLGRSWTAAELKARVGDAGVELTFVSV